MTKKIYLIRHGKTKENSKDLVQGSIETRISRDSIFKCLELSERLPKFDKAYCSTQERAIETFKLITSSNKNIDINYQYDKRLVEWNYGNLERSEFDFFKKNIGDFTKENPRDMLNKINYHNNYTLKSWDDYYQDYQSLLESWKEDLLSSDLNNILVVTHCGTIAGLLEVVHPIQGTVETPVNLGVTTLALDKNNQFLIETFNKELI